MNENATKDPSVRTSELISELQIRLTHMAALLDLGFNAMSNPESMHEGTPQASFSYFETETQQLLEKVDELDFANYEQQKPELLSLNEAEAERLDWFLLTIDGLRIGEKLPKNYDLAGFEELKERTSSYLRMMKRRRQDEQLDRPQEETEKAA